MTLVTRLTELEWYQLVLAYVGMFIIFGIIMRAVHKRINFTNYGLLVVWAAMLLWPLTVALVLVACLLAAIYHLIILQILRTIRHIYGPLVPHLRH